MAVEFPIKSFFTTVALLAAASFTLPVGVAAAQDRVIGAVASTDGVAFTLHLPLRNSAELDALMAAQATKGSPLYHHWLSRTQFRNYFGPAPATVRRLIETLRANGLTATQTSTQMLAARGSARAIERLFATKLTRLANRRSGRLRVATLGTYAVPTEIARSGATVVDLRANQASRPELRLRGAGFGMRPANRTGHLGTYWADDLKQAYQYPSYEILTGAGVNVAFVAGGDFSDTDLALYLQHEKIGNSPGDLAPAPQALHVLLPGARGFDPTSVDSGEADLDSQQIAMQAPGATLTGFIMPDDSDGSFLDAYTQIVESNGYDVVSTSYAECELFYTAAYSGGIDQTGILLAYNDLFRQGNVQGTTFVVGSGDEGALACPQPGYFNNAPTTPPTVYKSLLGVSANADLPTVIGVGGGELNTQAKAGSLDSKYWGEVGYSDPYPTGDPYGDGNLVTSLFGAGGGISTIFKKPSYQKLVDTGSDMRTVPDVGGHVGRFTDSGSSDFMVFDGQIYGGVLGTSAAAPDFAALLALKVESEHSRLGLENHDIYQLESENAAAGYRYFHDANRGDDGHYAYAGRHGYNYIYGVGSARGHEFLELPFAPYAKDPQTASNP